MSTTENFVENTILTIKYKRVVGSYNVTLTADNCNTYGYVATSTTIDGKSYTVFYKAENDPSEIEPYTISGETAVTNITSYSYQSYSHNSPPNSKYTISYADVDKQGSGRNDQTGEMYRDRVGHYVKLDVAWDLIPDTDEYNKWYKILVNLPPKFEITFLSPSGENETIETYRGDIQTDLYYYHYDATKNEMKQIWQSLGTTFTQWDVTPYDDTVEPTL